MLYYIRERRGAGAGRGMAGHSSGSGSGGLYHEAASLVERVRGGRGRVKSLCFAARHGNKKALFAVVTGACKGGGISSIKG